MGLNVWFIPLTLGAAVAGQLVGGGSGESGEDKGQHKQA